MLFSFYAVAVASIAPMVMILWDVLRHPEPPAAPIMVLTYDTDGRIIGVPTTTYYQDRGHEHHSR